MSACSYIVAEGVSDVTFLGKLLSTTRGATRIMKLEDLDESFRPFVNSFTWPSLQGRGEKRYHNIGRLAVPAPVIYQLPTHHIVMLRNAQGITEVVKTLTVDSEAFARLKIVPEAIGIVLDSDDEPPLQRFQKLKTELSQIPIHTASVLGEVSEAAPRVGVFALPEPGKAGTIEDVLLTLGKNAYPELYAAADAYTMEWWKPRAESPESEWKELAKPAGRKKAVISAMTALLKPGKSTQASLDDNRWISVETVGLECLKPCLDFLGSLLPR